MNSPEVAYTPGDWVAVIGTGLWAIFDLRIDDGRVQALWEAAGAGVEEILDVLVRQGLRALPGFAIVGRDGNALRYAVRQPARLAHQSGAANAEIGASSLDAWTNGHIEQLPDRLVLEAPATGQTLRLPTGLGVASAHMLFVDFVPTHAPADSANVNSDPASGAEVGGRESDAAPEARPVPERVDDSQENDHAETYYQLLVSSTVERDALLSKLVDEAGAPPVQQGDGEASTPAKEPTADSSTPRAISEATSVWTEDLEAPGTDATPAEPSRASDAQATGGVIDGVPWAGSVNLDQNVSVPGPAPTTYQAPSKMALPAFSPNQPVVVPSADVPESAAQTPPYPPDPVSTGTDDDTASVTISRAALLRQLADEHGSGTKVLALRCGLGHLSPTYSATCRVCGVQLPEQAPIEAARPPLGRLVLSNGSTVLLDRGVIFGRAPESDATDAASRPNLVRLVESGEISRMHASVLLDGWQVLLRDLGSQNGTILTLPGHEPEQIRPNEDYVLAPGSVIAFADVVSAKFEVTE